MIAAKGASSLIENEIIEHLQRYGLLYHYAKETIIDRFIAKYKCNENEIEKLKEKFYRQHHFQSDSDCQLWLQKHGLSEETYRERLIRSVKTEKFKQEKWAPQLKGHFLSQKDNLDVVSFSIIQIRDRDLAQELYYRIADGEQSFFDAARLYSEGSEAIQGGYKSRMKQGNLPQDLVSILIGCQIGHLQEPISIGEWTFLIRLEEFIPARFDEDTQQVLLNELFEGWIKERTSEYLSEYISSFNQN